MISPSFLDRFVDLFSLRLLTTVVMKNVSVMVTFQKQEKSGRFFGLSRKFDYRRQVPKSHSSSSSSSCCYQFSKKAFLIRNGAQRNFAYTFMLTYPTDLPSRIFHLFSN